MNIAETPPTERRRKALQAIKDLGRQRSDHAVLKVRCPKSHTVAAVYKTEEGPVVVCGVGPGGHGSRDREANNRATTHSTTSSSTPSKPPSSKTTSFPPAADVGRAHSRARSFRPQSRGTNTSSPSPRATCTWLPCPERPQVQFIHLRQEDGAFALVPCCLGRRAQFGPGLLIPPQLCEKIPSHARKQVISSELP